jgi:hypothetical protein
VYVITNTLMVISRELSGGFCSLLDVDFFFLFTFATHKGVKIMSL